MAIFSDLIEKAVKVFMDDFSVYGKTFGDCLANLDKVLRRCKRGQPCPELGKVSFYGQRRNCPWA
jgi:hypothetical protein